MRRSAMAGTMTRPSPTPLLPSSVLRREHCSIAALLRGASGFFFCSRVNVLLRHYYSMVKDDMLNVECKTFFFKIQHCQLHW